MENTKQQVISREEARQQGLKHYFTGKPCKRGHVAKRYVSTHVCVECGRLATKDWQEENRGRASELQQNWVKKQKQTPEGRQKLRVMRKPSQARYNRSEKGRASLARGGKAHRDRVAAREGMSFTRWYWQKHPEAKTHSRLNVLIASSLASQGKRKAKKTEEYLGCTVAECRAHLESLFLSGMSWDNHGEWHIDHIRPCASFDFNDQEQIKECMHYTNLQPLWAKDNLSKSDTWEEAV
jgi:hypothetical protein